MIRCTSPAAMVLDRPSRIPPKVVLLLTEPKMPTSWLMRQRQTITAVPDAVVNVVIERGGVRS